MKPKNKLEARFVLAVYAVRKFVITKISKPVYAWLRSYVERFENEKRKFRLLKFLRVFEKQVDLYPGGFNTPVEPHEIRRASLCQHLKGGRVRGGYRDPAVRTHTFADATQTVKCMLCGTEWSAARGNLKEGLKLAAQSTNTPSSSEIVTYRG